MSSIKLATSSKRAYITSITITYEEASVDPVAVTGVSLDKSEKSIEVGEAFKLTSAITPSNATNKNVTWSSSKESVATVSSGTVTGVAEGSATITITTEDGEYTATCEVTVTAAVAKTEYAFDLSKDYTTTATEDEISWANPIVSIVNTKGSTACNNYYPGTSGKSYTSTRFYKNSVLTITPLNGLGIAKIEFTATTNDYATALSGSSWSNASAAVDETDTKLVIVTPNDRSSAFSATINATCGFTQIKVYYTGDVTATLSVSAAKWATFIAPFACALEDGVKAYTAADNDGTITFTEVETTIPAETPVVVYHDGAYTKAYTGEVTSKYATYTKDALVGVLAAKTGIEAATGKTNYVLQNNAQGVGFYKVASGTISLKANRAYMSIDESSAIKDFFDFDFKTTGIQSILNPAKAEQVGIYDLAGNKLSAPQKGINIINGVKVLVK